MTNFYVHSPEGQVLMSGTCAPGELHLQVVLGSITKPGTAIIGKQYVLDTGELVDLPERPDENHFFDYVQKKWNDPRTLADLKILKNTYINDSRLDANQSYFMFLNKRIAVDELSRGDIDAMHGQILFNQALPTPWIGGWKAMDNTYVAIPDMATWGLFYKAMVTQGTSNFTHAQDLKNQLAAATTIAAVANIVW